MTDEITKLNKRKKIPKDAYNVVGGTSPGWSIQNSGLTDEELNMTENEKEKEIIQLRRQLQHEKEKLRLVSVYGNYLCHMVTYHIW